MIVNAAGLRVSIRDPGKEGSLGDRAAFAQVFLAGEYDFLLAKMSLGDIVLDAGANIGCFTLLASRKVGPRGVVIAVEPEPHNAACLSTNLRLNNIANVVVVERALGPLPDRTVDIVGTGTTASVAEGDTKSHVWDPKAGIARTTVKTISVDGVLKDSSVDRLDIIKMDVEGAENSIFAAPSTSTVLGMARAIAVEVHDREGLAAVRTRLTAEGYSNVGQVKAESTFLISSIRHGIRRPDLVLRLYRTEIATVVARMISGAITRQQPLPAADLLGLVYASR